MKSSDFWLAVAEEVDRSRREDGGLNCSGICSAISRVAFINAVPGRFREARALALRKLYRDDFQVWRRETSSGGSNAYYWGHPSWCSDEDHNARILAVLFLWRRALEAGQ